MPQSPKTIAERILKFFDKLEDRIRAALSRHPVPYALIGGFGIVLFWRGVWHTADLFPFLTGPMSILISAVVLLATGLFVSFFIGETIVVSGLKHEKKLTEKTEAEVQTETGILVELHRELHEIRTKLDEINKRVNGPGAN